MITYPRIYLRPTHPNIGQIPRAILLIFKRNSVMHTLD